MLFHTKPAVGMFCPFAETHGYSEFCAFGFIFFSQTKLLNAVLALENILCQVCHDLMVEIQNGFY